MNTQSQIHTESMVTQQKPPSVQTAVTNAPRFQPSRRVVKRRARKACLSCRGRKVRCNAESHGMPCLNCSMDSIECVISRERRPSRRARSFSRIPWSTPATSPSSEKSNYRAEENSIDRPPGANMFMACINSKHAKAECGPQYDGSSKDRECFPENEEFSHLLNVSLAHIVSQICTHIDTTSAQGRPGKELVDYLTASLKSPSHFKYCCDNSLSSLSHGNSHDLGGLKFSEAGRLTIPNDEVNSSAEERSTRPVENQSHTKCEQVFKPTSQQLLRECYDIAIAASKAIDTAVHLFSDAHGREQVPPSCNCKCGCVSNSNTDASDGYTSTPGDFSTQASELFTSNNLKRCDQTDRLLVPIDFSRLDVFSPAGAFLDNHNHDPASMDSQQQSLPNIYGSVGAMFDLEENILFSDYI